MGRELEVDITDPVQVSQGNRESLKKTWGTARAMTQDCSKGEGYSQPPCGPCSWPWLIQAITGGQGSEHWTARNPWNCGNWQVSAMCG